MSTNYDFTIIKAEDQTLLTLQYFESDGTVIPLTGCTFKMTAKDSLVSTPFLDFDSSVDTSNMVVSTYTLTVKLSSAEADAIEVTGGDYDLWIIDSDSNKYKLLYGKITVERSITDV